MKTVFITGAAKRLGRELAGHLSRSGYRVVAHYHTSESEARTLQEATGCVLFRADLSTIPIAELQGRLQEEVGNVDVLVNNASSFGKSVWREIHEEMWDAEMSVNLKIPFFLMQYFGTRMKAAGHGKILNMVDIAAERPYLPYLPYSIAKAGLVSATRAMARALAPEVQVNAIAPGTILFVEGMPETAQQKALEKIPAGRTATIEEYLKTVDFLLSGVDYITGQVLTLDGGRSLTW
ncbi:MAG TPA: SDR family oxidoreductase [Acidobacteriota bacterium]|nr:SDR family oxidoreductase [Acidobacteriota bacterium]